MNRTDPEPGSFGNRTCLDLSNRLIRSSICIIGFTIVVFVAWHWIVGREPIYQGRTLSSWMEDLETWQVDTNVPACQALRAMGTNAVPFLVAQIAREDPAWRRAVVPMLSRRGITNLNASPSFMPRIKAARALELLGAAARPALPLLIQAIKDAGERGSSAGVGLNCIAQTVPETIPTMVKELDMPFYRSTLIRIIGANTNHAEVCLPFLIGCLSDPAPETRRVGLWALGRYGTNAQPAQSAVQARVSDSNPLVAGEAVKALENIEGGRGR